MQVGLMAPQGWKGEYDGWDPADAWARTIELATAGRGRSASRRCGSSITSTRSRSRPTRSRSSRSRSCPRWRWRPSASGSATWSSAPGSATRPSRPRWPRRIDVISGGRFELGIGAGWKEEEWRAYGYGFPTIGERMDALGDNLEVIRAMLGARPGDVRRAVRHVRGAINVPKGIQQPRIPIIVGGNGERVTAGYAIRYADELNYVFLDAPRDRRADGRGPRPLRGRGPRSRDAPLLALHPRRGDARRRARRGSTLSPGSPRSGSTGSSASRPAGRRRLEAQAAFAEDCRAAGRDAWASCAGVDGSRPARRGSRRSGPIRRSGA